MAITKAITKVSVRESSGNKAITLRATVSDNGVEYAAQDFTLDYNQDKDVEVEVKKLQEKMQKFIDITIVDITYFNHIKLDNAVVFLNANCTP